MSEGYIHGYTDEEAERLLAQAEFLAPFVIDGLPLDGVTSLLEVGVGVGAETQQLRRRWPKLRVTGVDVSQGLLERARQTLAKEPRDQVSLVRGSGARLPFAESTFDGAVFIWVLEHVPDPLATMREAARCLQPGARLLAVEVYNQTLLVEPRHAAIDDYFAALSQTQARAGGHPNIAPRLLELAAKAGLELVEFKMVPVLGDGRDRVACIALIRYFEGLCRSAEPQIRAAGLFPAARIADVWRAFDEVCASPDPLLCYVGGRLHACKPQH